MQCDTELKAPDGTIFFCVRERNHAGAHHAVTDKHNVDAFKQAKRFLLLSKCQIWREMPASS